MNTLTKVLPIVAMVAAFLTVTGCNKHDQPNTTATEESHAEKDHELDHSDEHDTGRADEDDHEEHAEDVVRMTTEQLQNAGVLIEPLRGGVIATHITLPAEVGLNLDTVLHVTPRVPGIVTEVHGYLGLNVKPGDLLAVLESPELGKAKIAFLLAEQTKALADAEHQRQKTISENTATLLQILQDQPELDTLRSRASALRIGENKGKLLSAYARLKVAEANYTRERDLRKKGLSTQPDLLAAKVAFSSDQAQYIAAYEDIDFTYQLRFQDAERAASVAASAVHNAQRQLHMLGLSEKQITGITLEPHGHVARYELTAATGGRIIDKHITPGEKVDTDAPVYTIADLRTVWLNISVYARYAGDISSGQSVIVRVGDRTATGVVDYISPVLSEATRTVSARVVLENSNSTWKPGEFVTAQVETGHANAIRIIPLEAIQTFEGRKVVFVQDADGIEPIPVRLGRQNAMLVEILNDDIPLGSMVVTKNSFLMKAELGKSAAGHEH